MIDLWVHLSPSVISGPDVALNRPSKEQAFDSPLISPSLLLSPASPDGWREEQKRAEGGAERSREGGAEGGAEGSRRRYL